VLLDTLDPNRDNETLFSEQRTKLVSQRRSLLNHALTGISQRFDILLLSSFNRNKVDARAACCFSHRQRIICIIFLASDKGFHVLGRYLSDVVSHSSEGSAPEVQSRADFHRDKRAGLKLSKRIQQFLTRYFSVSGNGTINHPDTVLKNRFGNVDANNSDGVHMISLQN